MTKASPESDDFRGGKDFLPEDLRNIPDPGRLIALRKEIEDEGKKEFPGKTKRVRRDERTGIHEQADEIFEKEISRGRLRFLQRVYSSFMGNDLTIIAQRALFLTLTEEVLLRASGREFNWAETGVLFGANFLYSMYYGVDKSPRKPKN